MSPQQNFEATKKAIGYVERKEATQADYDRIGFMSGLEVHQQLATKEKLFCHCPAGHFQKEDEYDAELLRHMRPTLSEMGGYDGTALMEFKTRKNIVYHIAHETACTYEIDDTPPFPLNPEALQYALEIALASKLNIVGEVHVTRKQYLDGSIPTGFQRTAILGVEGEIHLRSGKRVGLTQLSIEEDACREVSDVRHIRVYRTDRLGMPLIETVTDPDLVNPTEVGEAGDAIRFLNRSTGRVRTGSGAGREDVNVSCKGGTRIEVKGVSHTKWLPDVSHYECFRQWALLAIRDQLKSRCSKEQWAMSHMELNPKDFNFYYTPITEALERGEKLIAVNLPHFAGLLSHFTQPGRPFYDEIVNRLKVIACIERPNMATSEDLEDVVSQNVFSRIAQQMHAGEDDAQIIFWAPDEDVAMGIEVIEERCQMAFDGVPKETRKVMNDHTSIFERVLPGADRMYPDTDSAPIPLSNDYIEELRTHIPEDIMLRYEQMKAWKVPTDCYNFIFTHNYYPRIKSIVEMGFDAKRVGCFFGHTLKHLQGVYGGLPFCSSRIVNLFRFIKEQDLDVAIAKSMLEVMFDDPEMDCEEALVAIGFVPSSREEIMETLNELKSEPFEPARKDTNEADRVNNLMGRLRWIGLGNMSLTELAKEV